MVEEKDKKISFSLRLPKNLRLGVKSKAKQLGMSENSVISLAVSEFVDKYKKGANT